MIDLSSTTQIRLLKEDYKRFPDKAHYNMKYADKTNVDKF